MATARRVTVVGSANVDLVLRVRTLPRRGETVLATGVARHPGGKGNNQAIAAARAGAPTSFIAAIGADPGGDELIAVLDAAGVDLHLRRPVTPTGTALITVDDHAENTIVVESGANAELVDLTPAELAVVAHSGVLLLQLESPLPTVIAAARTARSAGVTVVLNAAPFRPLPGDLVDALDVLVVNEGEAAALPEAVQRVVPALVVTRGADGVAIRDRNGAETTIAARPVRAVDTTGAGDAFCGVLAVGLAEDRSLHDAARIANVAASLAVGRAGAVSSIPTRAEIDAALEG